MNEVKKRSNVSCVNVLILTILRHLFYISFASHKPLDQDALDVDEHGHPEAQNRSKTSIAGLTNAISVGQSHNEATHFRQVKSWAREPHGPIVKGHVQAFTWIELSHAHKQFHA